MPVFSSVIERVIGSRKATSSKFNSSDDMVTIGLASFSSLSSSRRTVAWIA